MKVGILGGSFDPIHNGHLYMAKQALLVMDLDEVWLIPAGHSPNKDESSMTSAEDRMKMCVLSCEDEPFIQANSIEVDSKDRSYTYLTMQKLAALYPMNEFYFILGADSLDYFEQWKNPDIICEIAQLVVINRDDFLLEALQEKADEINRIFPAKIHIVPCDKYDISSSEIRNVIRNGLPVPEDKIPKKVLSYINQHHLYR